MVRSEVDVYVRETREASRAAAEAEYVVRAAALESATGTSRWLETFVELVTHGYRLSEEDVSRYVEQASVDSIDDLYDVSGPGGMVTFQLTGDDGVERSLVLFLPEDPSDALAMALE